MRKSSDVALCPVNVSVKYLSMIPNGPTPLFCHFDLSPLTRYQVNRTLVSSLKFNHILSDEYKYHSFRIGAATSAAAIGFSDEKIMQICRWKSRAFTLYVRIPMLYSRNPF